jgi:hypothetical protein
VWGVERWRGRPFSAAAKYLIIRPLLERESAKFADSLSSIPLTHSNLAAAHETPGTQPTDTQPLPENKSAAEFADLFSASR